jgi:hypothetical protein
MRNGDGLYEQDRGRDALDRQRAEAENRHVCCGELRAHGHHPLCRNYEELETPEHIDGQESLL